MWLCLVGWAD